LRQCVRETILTYPLLAGIGVTAGENMKNRNDEYDREKWLWQTYGLGIMDAKKQQPGRQVRFIHRVWNTGLGKIMTDFAANYPDSFEIGFKYARAHMYSSAKPPFCKSLLKEMQEHIEKFLTICDKYGIKPGFTFFDDCWNRKGVILESPPPIKGRHNGRWAACPQDAERTKENLPKFRAYIQDIIRPHHKDPRVLWWEIFNEPKLQSKNGHKSFSWQLRELGYKWAK
ncbi:unnamed protein product, partial [marine sediment metagenome]